MLPVEVKISMVAILWQQDKPSFLLFAQRFPLQNIVSHLIRLVSMTARADKTNRNMIRGSLDCS